MHPTGIRHMKSRHSTDTDIVMGMKREKKLTLLKRIRKITRKLLKCRKDNAEEEEPPSSSRCQAMQQEGKETKTRALPAHHPLNRLRIPKTEQSSLKTPEEGQDQAPCQAFLTVSRGTHVPCEEWCRPSTKKKGFSAVETPRLVCANDDPMIRLALLPAAPLTELLRNGVSEHRRVKGAKNETRPELLRLVKQQQDLEREIKRLEDNFAAGDLEGSTDDGPDLLQTMRQAVEVARNTLVQNQILQKKIRFQIKKSFFGLRDRQFDLFETLDQLLTEHNSQAKLPVELLSQSQADEVTPCMHEIHGERVENTGRLTPRNPFNNDIPCVRSAKTRARFLGSERVPRGSRSNVEAVGNDRTSMTAQPTRLGPAESTEESTLPRCVEDGKPQIGSQGRKNLLDDLNSARTRLHSAVHDLDNRDDDFARQAQERNQQQAVGKVVETFTEFDLRLLQETQALTRGVIGAEEEYERAKAAAVAGGVQPLGSDIESGFVDNTDDGYTSSSDEEMEGFQDRSCIVQWLKSTAEAGILNSEGPMDPNQRVDSSSQDQQSPEWEIESVGLSDSISVVAEGRYRKRIDRWRMVCSSGQDGSG